MSILEVPLHDTAVGV